MRAFELQILGFLRIDKARIFNHKLISQATKKKTLNSSKFPKTAGNSFKAQNPKHKAFFFAMPENRVPKEREKERIIKKLVRRLNKNKKKREDLNCSN